MTYLLLDLEANGLDPTVVHCICTKTYPQGDKRTFTDMSTFVAYVKKLKPKKVFIHNGLGYDIPVINKLVEEGLIPNEDVVDTLVVSKLMDYRKFRTHSLKEVGQYLKSYKGDYNGGWDVCTQEMIDYCEQDVEVLESIVKHQWDFIVDKKNVKALRVEHDMAAVCREMQDNGFKFNVEEGEQLLSNIKEEKEALEAAMRKAFPPKLIELKRVKLRYTKEGKLFANILKDMATYPKVEVDEETNEVIVYDWTEFNPASPKERIDILWEAGWEPREKTKGHKDATTTR